MSIYSSYLTEENNFNFLMESINISVNIIHETEIKSKIIFYAEKVIEKINKIIEFISRKIKEFFMNFKKNEKDKKVNDIKEKINDIEEKIYNGEFDDDYDPVQKLCVKITGCSNLKNQKTLLNELNSLIDKIKDRKYVELPSQILFRVEKDESNKLIKISELFKEIDYYSEEYDDVIKFINTNTTIVSYLTTQVKHLKMN